MEILLSVAAKVAEYTVAPIGRQVGYLLFYRSNLKELAYQVENLENARLRVIREIEHATRNGEEIEDDVQYWLHRVDSMITEAQQFLEKQSHAKAGCSRWLFPNLPLRHRLSRKAQKIAEEVAIVMGLTKFDSVSYLLPRDPAGFIYTTRGTTVNLPSRETIKENILEALNDPDVIKVGVYGLGGVGKTTLVKEVAGTAMRDKLFDAVVFVVVSYTPDPRRIQDEIAEQFGLHLEEESLMVRADRLQERIRMEKKILIVLDDIWAELDLMPIGIPFGDKGCKLLLTSRRRDVLHLMYTQKNFTLEVLDEQETWELFKDVAGSVVEDPNLQSIAIEVAKSCAGLPVAIVMVGSALKNKDIHAWEDTLNRLNRVDNREMYNINSVLELSYHHLQSAELKELFLLFGVIGKYTGTNDLLKYCIGLGIFGYINTVEDARIRLTNNLSDLKASSLLLDDDTNVKMHDLVRDVAISIASRDQHIFTMEMDSRLEEWPTKDFLERCTQIIMPRCHILHLPERLNCPNLQFLYFDNANDLIISDSFFAGMENLSVLNLTCMNMPSLPTSICSLTKLQTLCLHQCSLGDMTRIGTLKNLEILSLCKSSMANLPIEIVKLTCLRMLDLSNSIIEAIPPNIISRLAKLEELYVGNTPVTWAQDNSNKPNENASLYELKLLPCLTALHVQISDASFYPKDSVSEKLERYKIFIGDVWQWSGKYETSRTLKLKLNTSSHLEYWIEVLLSRVEDLYLDEIPGISNVLYQLSVEGFPNLKHLHIQNNAKIKHIVDLTEGVQGAVTDSFPSLVTLVLHNLINLQRICHGRLTVNSFCKLRFIKVEKCHQLENVLSLSMVERLSQLDEIEVSECKSVKGIVTVGTLGSDNDVITVEKVEFHHLRSLTLHHLPALYQFYSDELALSESKQMPLFSAKVAFPSLKTLKLSSLNFKNLWDQGYFPENSVTMLTDFIVEDCRELTFLLSSLMVESFSKLTRLEISKCPMMEEIVKATEEGTMQTKVAFPKLETLKLSSLNLKSIWDKGHLPAISVANLTHLIVEDCGELRFLFSSLMVGSLVTLKQLQISKCRKMEELIKATEKQGTNDPEVTFHDLETLKLSSLNSLKNILWDESHLSASSMNNLTDLIVEDCGELRFLFSSLMVASLRKLRRLQVSKCRMMEQVIKAAELQDTNTEVFFPNLEIIIICDMENLKTVWHLHQQPAQNSFARLKRIEIRNCNKLENIISVKFHGQQTSIVNNLGSQEQEIQADHS